MANAQDPRGWLDACPELSQFGSDPAVSSAIAAGDGKKLFAALEARRKGKRGPFEARAIDAILARRRLFLAAVIKAPGLSTLNGIGTRIYGRSDVASDGTYVGTLFFCILYLPIWPIAQYLLWSQGKQYSFFGEVPLSRTMRLWRAAVGAATVATAAAIAFAALQSGRTADVWLVNGLDVPVVVEAGGARANLPSGRREVHKMPVGKQRFKATAAGGRVIEELDADVPRWTDLVAYNVVGAAPLYAEGVIYHAKGSSPPKEEEAQVQFFAGRSFVTRDRVPYLFKTAPNDIEMGSGSKREVRWRADLLDGGWRSSTGYLAFKKRYAEASAVAAAVARAEPAEGEAFAIWIQNAQLAGGPKAALEAARAAAEMAPDDLDAQRVYSHYLVAAGQLEEARRIFAARAEKAPDSVAAAYLVARVAPRSEALARYEQLVAQHPDDGPARRALAFGYVRAERFAEAIREYEALGKLHPDLVLASAKAFATALVAAGRTGEALRRMDALSSDGSASFDAAVLRARLAHVARTARGTNPALEVIAAAQKNPADQEGLRALVAAWTRVLAGGPAPGAKQLAAIENESEREAAKIMVTSASDPAAALAAAARADVRALSKLEEEVAVLLAAEAARRGDDRLAVRLAEASGQIEAPGRAVVAFVKGEEPEELVDVAWEIRAPLLFARARAAEAAGKDARRLYEAARKADVLRGAVATAMAGWPKP